VFALVAVTFSAQYFKKAIKTEALRPVKSLCTSEPSRELIGYATVAVPTIQTVNAQEMGHMSLIKNGLSAPIGPTARISILQQCLQLH